MVFTTQYIMCNISIVNYMYSESECFRSESNSEPPRWVFWRKLFMATARQLFL